MNLKKSALSIILVFSMVITIILPNLVFADTLDYSKSITKMKQIGVIDTALTDVNKKITKGDFIKAIAIAYGLADTAAISKGTTLFSDIDSSSDLSGYINAVIGQGILYGTDGDSFNPQDGETYGDLCVMMVHLLGYTKSDLTGTWPLNYIKKAADLKLTYQVNLGKDDMVPVWAEAVLFDRLFDTLMKGSTTQYFSDKYYTNVYANVDITGKLVEGTIVGNSKTSDTLGEDEVYMSGIGLTDKTKYKVNSDAGDLDLGAKYKLYLDGTTITKVCIKENSVENYAVTNVEGSTINYVAEDNSAKTMTLPKAVVYYYHGVAVDADVAIKAVRAYSSIILAKASGNADYDYGVILDPNFGQPYIYKQDNAELIDKFKNTKYSFIYRDANIQETDLNAYDVVYFVSDIWNKNTFIYVDATTVSGTITAFTPDILNPTGVTINKVNYSFSKYFNKAKLSNYDGSVGSFLFNTNINDFKTLVLGVDGTIVDIY